jgi:hypothetical protein
MGCGFPEWDWLSYLLCHPEASVCWPKDLRNSLASELPLQATTQILRRAKDARLWMTGLGNRLFLGAWAARKKGTACAVPGTFHGAKAPFLFRLDTALKRRSST